MARYIPSGLRRLRTCRVPPEQRWSLALLYLVFVVSILALYFPCRWFAGVKKRSSSALLRYV